MQKLAQGTNWADDASEMFIDRAKYRLQREAPATAATAMSDKSEEHGSRKVNALRSLCKALACNAYSEPNVV